MTGCFTQQSQPRLPSCSRSRSVGRGQGRRQPARVEREPLTARRRRGYSPYKLVLIQPATAVRFLRGNSSCLPSRTKKIRHTELRSSCRRRFRLPTCKRNLTRDNQLHGNTASMCQPQVGRRQGKATGFGPVRAKPESSYYGALPTSAFGSLFNDGSALDLHRQIGQPEDGRADRRPSRTVLREIAILYARKDAQIIHVRMVTSQIHNVV